MMKNIDFTMKNVYIFFLLTSQILFIAILLKLNFLVFVITLAIKQGSPWNKPVELNGVNYLKSHSQVLLDRTGASDNLWFLAQNYLASLNENRQTNWKYHNIYQGGGGTSYISHILMFYWFEAVLY
jgi:hypothetical protein